MNTTVPMMDLGLQYAALQEEIDRRMRGVLQGTDFILGREVAEFERAFAAYCECRFAIGVASGLDAIKLSLRALDIGPGDEVITAANTFIATALAITSVGAVPVLVDVDEHTMNIDPARIAAALTPRTRAVMPVHLYGQPADMEPILALAQAHRLHVLEDASQAHGARCGGRRVGSLGVAAAFSLYPGKNLGAYGDAGVVTTSDEALAGRITAMRNYGSRVKYYHDELGENSRLDTLQAAVLNAKLPHLDDWNAARRRVAARYTAALEGVGDLVLPHVLLGLEPVYHQYVIRTARRDALLQHLHAAGVACLIHYPVPIHLQKAYAGQGWKAGEFPVSERCAARVLSLPMFPELTEEQIGTVTDAVGRFYREDRADGKTVGP